MVSGSLNFQYTFVQFLCILVTSILSMMGGWVGGVVEVGVETVMIV